MESQIKSILNFEDGDGNGKAAAISSPRSLEACLRSGHDPQELMPRRENRYVVARQPLPKAALHKNEGVCYLACYTV